MNLIAESREVTTAAADVRDAVSDITNKVPDFSSMILCTHPETGICILLNIRPLICSLSFLMSRPSCAGKYVTGVLWANTVEVGLVLVLKRQSARLTGFRKE